MASEADVPPGEDDTRPYAKFVQQILDPAKFESFRETLDGDTVSDIHVHFHEDPANPESITSTIVLEDLYPVQTLYDLQTRIYIEKGELNRYHPMNQTLLLKQIIGYVPFLYVFNNQVVQVGNPYDRIQGDSYVKEFLQNGDIQLVKVASQERITLYTKLFQTPARTGQYELHCFLYDDILSRYEGVRPLSPEEWFGRVKPFFPLRQEQQPLEDMAGRVQRYVDRQKLLDCLETVLRDKGAGFTQPGKLGRGDPVSLSNFRMLRIGWRPLKQVKTFEPIQIDNIFYSMPLSEKIPYIRYFPKAATPLSKVYVKGPLPIPAMERPEILYQWAQENSPVPEEDIVICKVLMRSGAGSVPPLYATFTVFESGAAKFIIQPNEGEKSLSRLVELRELRETLEYITSIVPKQNPSPLYKGIRPRALFTPENIVLEDAYSVFSMWLDSQTHAPITKGSFRKLLPFFLPFVQVTNSPIAEQNPLVFLRYKGTDNFLTQSRDFQFLKAIMDLQSKKGFFSHTAMIRYYQNEFDVPQKTAEERVAAFLRNDIEYQVVNPETLTFSQVENPGIDIAVFGKHPSYTIHVYRVNDLYAYRSIITLLTLLIHMSPEEFGDDCVESARRMITDQAMDMKKAEASSASKSADVATLRTEGDSLVQTALLTAEATFGNEQEEFDDDFQDIDEDSFGVEDTRPAVIPEAVVPKTQKQKAEDEMPLTTLVASDAPDLPKEVDEEDDELAPVVQNAAQLKQIPAKTYFSERLQMYDRRLFSYKKTAGVKQYPRMCSSTAARQPTVMNDEEYARMKDIYAPDVAAGTVQFVDLPLKPLKPGEKYDSKYDVRTKERITTLRYGTALSSGIGNIYICSQYWCRKDEIVVLKRDFEATKDREGRPKPKNTCPFCYGALVQNRDAFVPGETVIERSVKDKGTRPHTFVQFLTTGQHPEGFYLPCCFLSDKPIYDTHPAFQSAKASKPLPTLKPTADPFVNSEAIKKQEEEDEMPMEEEIDGESTEDATPLFKVNYPQRLEQMIDKKPYITGAEKFPLIIGRDGPQVGVLSKAQDTYFAQTSIPGLVKQHHTVWKLITDESKKGDKKKGDVAVSGFLRIAVDNRKSVQAESFLAAMAPIVGFNSTMELKTHIMRIMTLRFFIQLNYGNFLLEFYDPNFVLPGYSPQNPKAFLQTFVKTHLPEKTLIGTNAEAILRAAKSWHRFHEMFRDVDVRKEYRQFAMMFSYPGYFTENGVLCIVLETDATGAVTVRCPPYGVSPEMAKRCDIAFVSFTPKAKLWEPIFYTKNNAATGEHSNQFIFSATERDSWPAIVRARADEFYRLCESSGLGLYTDSPFVNPKTLLPLGRALTLPLDEQITLFAVLRDSYNHVSAVLYQLEDNRLVFVHTIDDGTPHEHIRTEFDWETNMFRMADGDQVASFYTDILLPAISDMKEEIQLQYTPKPEDDGRFFKMPRVRVKGIPYVYGMACMGGLHVPVRAPIKEEHPYVMKQVMPWQMDKKLVFGEKEASVSMEMTPEDFQEIFQHLRLTFSNWFAFEATPDIKARVKEILFDMYGNTNTSIPLMEKREMLHVLLGPVVQTWLDHTTPVVGRTPSLRRIDCHLQTTSNTCTNFCVWKDKGGEEGQCLLHVNETVTMGTVKVPARSVLIAKLFEELIRFPLLRDQILKQKVSRYQKLHDAFRSGDEYIVSEAKPAWTELLRQSWQKDSYEKPRFFEELAVGSQRSDTNIIEEEKAPLILPVLPSVLKSLVQTKQTLYFFPGSFLELLGDLHVNLFRFFQATDATLDMVMPTSLAQMNEIAKQLQHSVAFIPFMEQNPILKQEAITAVRVKVGSVKSPTQPFFTFVQLPTGDTGVLSRSPSEILPIDASAIAQPFKIRFTAGPNLLTIS